MFEPILFPNLTQIMAEYRTQYIVVLWNLNKN
jgi:hypothetical protein